jgi:predicted transcriptional regulator
MDNQAIQHAAKAIAGRAADGQADVAKASGVSWEYIARLELGQQDPTLGTMRKLAKALKVTVGELVE